MNQLDRYIFGQILGPFGFFALIFTGVIWLSQSLRIIDLVVNNGQSAAVFAEFTALLLPTVMSVVMPVSAFAATLFALNRLYSESELVAMMAAGWGPPSLMRPVVSFGVVIMIAMMIVTLYLMPTAARQLRDRMADLRGDIASVLIRDGQFIHPADGLTIYVGASNHMGEMADIFIHDMREPERPVTYSANRAVLVRNGGDARVVMFDGTAQHFDERARSLSTLRFDTFTYDLSALMSDDGGRRRKPSEHYVYDLVAPPPEITGQSWYKAGDYYSEGHEQLSAPLYGLVLPMVALMFILHGGFRRRGFATQIWAAIGAGLAIRLAGVAAKALTAGNAMLWPTMYAPPLLALLVILWLLWRGPRVRRPATPVREVSA